VGARIDQFCVHGYGHLSSYDWDIPHHPQTPLPPRPNSVILSEVARGTSRAAQSKDPDDLRVPHALDSFLAMLSDRVPHPYAHFADGRERGCSQSKVSTPAVRAGPQHKSQRANPLARTRPSAVRIFRRSGFGSESSPCLPGFPPNLRANPPALRSSVPSRPASVIFVACCPSVSRSRVSRPSLQSSQFLLSSLEDLSSVAKNHAT